METKHTPGPWHHNGTEVSADAGVIVRSAAAYDALRKDLDLIVAAPDLLAVLDDAYVELTRVLPPGSQLQKRMEAVFARALNAPSNA